MSNRTCPFCASSDTRPWRRRPEGAFLLCGACGSYLKDISPDGFAQLHATAFEDGAFIQKSVGITGDSQPDFQTWDSLFSHLPAGRLLEIGPGTGHLLAAARDRGWVVEAVETSPSHRAWIERAWGIAAKPDLEDLPQTFQPDLIVMVNVLEHVMEPGLLLDLLARRLAPGGRLFISLPNARSSVASMAGIWWAMFKPSDHVSIPSRSGLQSLMDRSGWQAERIWSSELPLETPLGLAVAARDRWRSRAPMPLSPEPTPAAGTSEGLPNNRVLKVIRRIPPAWEPTARLAGWIGRGATLKAWLRQAPSPPATP